MNLFGIKIDLDKMNEVMQWGKGRIGQLIEELPKEKRTQEILNEIQEIVHKEIKTKLDPLLPKIEPTTRTLSDEQVLDSRAILLYHKANEIAFKAEKEKDILQASGLYQLSILISLEGDKRMPTLSRRESGYPWMFNRYTIALKKAKCYSVGLWACNQFFSKDNPFRIFNNSKSEIDAIERRSLFFKQNISESSNTLKEGWFEEAINEAKSLAKKADAITKEQFIAEDEAWASPDLKYYWQIDPNAKEHRKNCLRYSKMEAMPMSEWEKIGIPENGCIDCGGISECNLIPVEDHKIKL
jgi:hypothetical protein